MTHKIDFMTYTWVTAYSLKNIMKNMKVTRSFFILINCLWEPQDNSKINLLEFLFSLPTPLLKVMIVSNEELLVGKGKEKIWASMKGNSANK